MSAREPRHPRRLSCVTVTHVVRRMDEEVFHVSCSMNIDHVDEGGNQEAEQLVEKPTPGTHPRVSPSRESWDSLYSRLTEERAPCKSEKSLI